MGLKERLRRPYKPGLRNINVFFIDPRFPPSQPFNRMQAIPNAQQSLPFRGKRLAIHLAMGIGQDGAGLGTEHAVAGDLGFQMGFAEVARAFI